MYVNPLNYGRIALTIGLAALLYYLLAKTLSSPLTPAWTFILDDFHLIMHEAGHFVFMPFSSQTMNFGQLIYLLGGSLMQWILPVIFSIYFAFKKNVFASFVTLFWFGHSILNSVPYIADAKKMRLPLLGGDSSIHDWNFILRYTGLLEHTETIAYGVYIIAILIVTLSTLGALISILWSLVYPSKEDQLYRKVFK